MSDLGWLKEVTAAGAIILFCYCLLRAIIGRADKLTNAVLDRAKQDSKTIQEMSEDISVTLRNIEQSMSGRDQIILNHLEHSEQAIKQIADTQLIVTNILDRICREFDINGDYRRDEE